MMKLLISISLLLVSTDGFIFNNAAPNPVLQKFVQVQTGTLLKIGLDVGKEEKSHMNINGLVIELHQDQVPKGSGQHPSMPGAQGPHPNLSTGVNNLAVQEEGSYINIDGMQHVNLKDGCWELVWKDGAPAGSLVCGFHHTKDAKRNDAIFPKGRIYMSFPVWTKDTLREYQEKKLSCESRAKDILQEKEDQLAKMRSTSNPIVKALHFRNACSAMERYSLTGLEAYKVVPLDDDVMPLQGDIMLTTKGTVWTKEDKIFGKEHSLLGSASVSPFINKELMP